MYTGFFSKLYLEGASGVVLVLALVWVLVEVDPSPRRMRELGSGIGWGRAVMSVNRERRRVVVEGEKRMLVDDMGLRRDKGLVKRRNVS